MKEREAIRDLLLTLLEATPFFVVDVAVSGSRMIPKVTVTLDGDEGIGIDACADISRQLDKEIEQASLFPKGYVLEVSSPGVDQPLKLPRQYPKHVGRQVRIQLQDGSVKTGKLEAYDNQIITLLEEIIQKTNKKKKDYLSVQIPLQEIEKTTVLISFK